MHSVRICSCKVAMANLGSTNPAARRRTENRRGAVEYGLEISIPHVPPRGFLTNGTRCRLNKERK